MTHNPNIEQLIIRGQKKLHGKVFVSGSKNASLPIIAATMLAKTPSRLHNIPRLSDTTAMLEALNSLDCNICIHEDQSVSINPASYCGKGLSKSIAKKLRGSFLLLGPLLAHYQKADIPLPGGCNIGARPVDVHLKGLEKMGACIELHGGVVHASCQGRLQGTDLELEVPSVTGTENLIMAASLADGITRIHNAAREPEINNLCNFINLMGGKIQGAGESTIEIEGVDSLDGKTFNIIYDRLEAGTYMIATAITQGEIHIKNIHPDHLTCVIKKLKEVGAEITVDNSGLHMIMNKKPKAVSISTEAHPGFPTDLQAQWLALNCIAEGSASIQENIFESRFTHATQLQKMGARIQIEGNRVLTQGSDQLIGTDIIASDIRASAGLVLGALAAKGQTSISNLHHVDRGYVHLEENFSNLGADITRKKETLKEVNTS